ncbi:zinc transporter ZIP3-like isoform X1 [Clavelina lepadiformis]|uniref:zinc transporter ZIP3-like isoform X1 n=1 Tax=Clavelina lepadiformis TaxID=159417 RepID=UPI0040433265
MELLTEKIVFLLLLLALAFSAGFSPYVLRNRCLSPSSYRDVLLTLLNCISAGAFFATFFLHMLPEAQEELATVFHEDIHYPVTELLISLGFFFVMSVDQFVMARYGEKAKQTSMNECEIIENSQGTTAPHRTKHKPLLPTSDRPSSQDFPIYDSTAFLNENVNCVSNAGANATSTALLTANTGSSVDNRSLESTTGARLENIEESQQANHHSSNGHLHFDPNAQSSVRCLILLFALSIHALFEGLTIGFQTSASDLRTLMVTILIHKITLSFSYGISLVSNNSRLKFALASIFVFSIMAPIGVGVGTALNFTKDADVSIEKAVVVLQAFAVGTFVYVIFIEIIPREFLAETSHNRIKKMLSLFVGFSSIALLQLIPHEE